MVYKIRIWSSQNIRDMPQRVLAQNSLEFFAFLGNYLPKGVDAEIVGVSSWNNFFMNEETYH